MSGQLTGSRFRAPDGPPAVSLLDRVASQRRKLGTEHHPVPETQRDAEREAKENGWKLSSRGAGLAPEFAPTIGRALTDAERREHEISRRRGLKQVASERSEQKQAKRKAARKAGKVKVRPATDRQLRYIAHLAKRANVPPPQVRNRREAGTAIDGLLERAKS